MYIPEKDFDLFLNNIAKLLGNKCEILVHNFENGFEHTVIKIINGHISGREIGACPTNLFFEKFDSSDDFSDDFAMYFNRDDKGRLFKSSTTFFHNKEGKVIGAICINFDITQFVNEQRFMKEFLEYETEIKDVDNIEEKEVFTKNVNELMDYYLNKVEKEVGKRPEDMDRAEKIRALAYLDNKGILQIAKAHVRLCKFFHISTYTLYTYLDETRKGVGNKQ